jgi:hypothetical protein
LIFSTPQPVSAKSNDVDTSNLHSAFSPEDASSVPLKSLSSLLLDDADGNALRWNSNGIATAFNILAPLDENSFVSIMLPRASSVAFGLDPGFFTFHCDSTPPDNSVLDYLITNLPVYIKE